MPKQATLYPCVRPRGNSLQVEFTLANGKRRFETIQIKPSQANQLIWHGRLSVIKEEINTEKFNYANWFPNSKWLKKNGAISCKKTLRNELRRWYDRVEPELKASSARSYRTGINMMCKFLGDDALIKNITSHDIDRLIIKRRKQGTKTKTLRNQFGPLRGMLEKQTELPYELKMGLIAATKLKKTVAEKEAVEEADPFDIDEVMSLLSVPKGQNLNLLKFYLGSGARSGEAFPLCWEDVDYKKHGVNILRNRTEKVTSTCKQESMRFLPLGDLAWEAIISQEAHTKMLMPVAIGSFGKKRPVFYNPTKNQPWDNTGELTRYFWEPLMRMAGVRERVQYQTRHTFASLALMYGKNLYWVAMFLGHKNVQMVINSYGKYLQKADELKDHPDMKRIFENAGAAIRLGKVA